MFFETKQENRLQQNRQLDQTVKFNFYRTPFILKAQSVNSSTPLSISLHLRACKALLSSYSLFSEQYRQLLSLLCV